VLRGGSWSFKPRVMRSANRIRVTTGLRLNVIGFRIARTFF
ncbi:MAG TPA: Sulphatase-modifying factor protein, partial [Rhodospirillaceae bacterium]|nr:Sulphatase-modifying factor protein [Rhodospirillaceae bacterium]